MQIVKLFKVKALYKALPVIFFMLLVITTIAQENKKFDVDINTNNEEGGFFASPWIWVVGVAVFILMLVALMRSSRRKDV